MSRLDDTNLTLAEILAENGYATGAAVSAFVLSAQFGIDQGFAFFDDDMEEGDDTRALLVAHRAADKTTGRAESWLREHADERFFLWVHYYDPHFPRDPPKAFLEHNELPYDAEIAFADHELGSLLDVVETLGLTDKTLVVVAGDHGEGLGQHGETTHAALIYDSTIRVPLIMSCGSRLGNGVHVDRWVSLIDVMPTVLSLLGVVAPDELDGLDLTQPPAGDRVHYVEALEVLIAYGWASLLGVYDGSTKYVHGPRNELYDLAADPFEENNLVESDPARTAAMVAHLEAFYGDDLELAASIEPAGQLSAEALAKLEALGYLGNVSGEIPPPAQRPHPKDVMPLMRQTFAAIAVEKELGLDAVIVRLEVIVLEHPDFVAGHQHLGEAYVKARKFDAAEAEFARCLELRPGLLKQVLALARLKIRQRTPDEAIILYRQLLARVPDHFGALNELGRALMGQGDYPEAVDVLTRALRSKPRDPALPAMLIRAAAMSIRAGDVISVLTELLEADPNLPMVRISLAGLLAAEQQFALPVALLREGIELDPQQYELINNLAVILATCQDLSIVRPMEAATMMERVCDETQYLDPRYMHTLSLIYATMLRLDEAIDVATAARQAASSSHDPSFVGLVPAIGLSIQRYRTLKEQQTTRSGEGELDGS